MSWKIVTNIQMIDDSDACMSLTGERRDAGQVDGVPGGAWHDAGDNEAGVGVGARPQRPRRTAGQLAGGDDDDGDEQSGEGKALRRHYA